MGPGGSGGHHGEEIGISLRGPASSESARVLDHLEHGSGAVLAGVRAAGGPGLLQNFVHPFSFVSGQEIVVGSSSNNLDCHFERVVGDEVDELEILSGGEEALAEACQESVPPLSCQIGVGRVGLNRQGSHSSEVLCSVPL